MRKLRIKFLALLMITSVAFLSCKKEDRFSPKDTTASRPIPINPAINSADWRITMFQINGVNETKNYRGYLFEFANKGVLKAIIKDREIIGTWGVGLKDNPSSFRISFPSEPLNKLNNSDWHIMSRTSTDLMLEYNNRKTGEVARLTFQRPIQLIDTGFDDQNPN